MSEQKNIIKLRLEGLPETIVKFEDLLLNSELAKVLQSSKFYSNRFSSVYSRKYLEVEFVKRGKLKVVVKEPGKQPEIRQINNNLRDLQDIVGGRIEVVTLKGSIAVICDDEGKLKGYAPNLKYGCDFFAGTVIFVCTEGEDFASLSEEEMDFVFGYCMLFGLEGKCSERD